MCQEINGNLKCPDTSGLSTLPWYFKAGFELSVSLHQEWAHPEVSALVANSSHMWATRLMLCLWCVGVSWDMQKLGQYISHSHWLSDKHAYSSRVLFNYAKKQVGFHRGTCTQCSDSNESALWRCDTEVFIDDRRQRSLSSGFLLLVTPIAGDTRPSALNWRPHPVVRMPCSQLRPNTEDQRLNVHVNVKLRPGGLKPGVKSTFVLLTLNSTSVLVFFGFGPDSAFLLSFSGCCTN